MLRRTAFVVALCSLGIAPLSAQEGSWTGRDTTATGYKPAWFYVGANYGFYKARGGDFDDDADLIEGMIGFHFTPYVGIEASVIDFGRFGDDLAEADVDGWTGAAVLRFPVTETTGVYAKGGLLFWDAAVERADEVSEAIDDSDFFYGVGLDFWVSPMISLAVEYSRYEVESTDIDAAKVGVRLNF